MIAYNYVQKNAFSLVGTWGGGCRIEGGWRRRGRAEGLGGGEGRGDDVRGG